MIAPGTRVTIKGGPTSIVGVVDSIVGDTASVTFPRSGRTTSWLVRDLVPVIES